MYRVEYRQRTKTGEWKWILSMGRVVARDSEGKSLRMLGTHTDITERKRLEEERWLLEAKFLRAQRVESIGSLASGIAHDLNNILTPILMCAPLLTQEETHEGREEVAQTILSSAQRAVEIVKQLLNFARGKDGTKGPIQIRHILSDMAKLARETFPRTISVDLKCDSDLWTVQADTTQMHQVFLNLCVNARDAMPNGGRLTLFAENVILDEHYVAMHKDTVPGPYVRIQVEDTGTGISEEHQCRIFETFFTTKSEGQGTGLGLTTVQGIVHDHKGFVTFRSKVGKGTNFTIHLPAATTEEQQQPCLDQPSKDVPCGRGELILVVDDEPSICESTRRTLERHGYAVLEATNGIEGLARFSGHRDDIRCVVTDSIMPLMDGVTFCRALRAISPDIAIVVSSGGLVGKGSSDALRAFEELGGLRILHKPHTAEVLLQTLAEMLQPVSDTRTEGEFDPAS